MTDINDPTVHAPPKKKSRKTLPRDHIVARASKKANPKKKAELRGRPSGFMPGSLNDQIAKLELNESMAKVKRLSFESSTYDAVNLQARNFHNKQNSILSGGIAKVRSSAGHESKTFKMERGTYMSAGNDAMFALLTITRTS